MKLLQNISIRRLGNYLFGMLCISLGIVLCAKCGLGVSPISSIPFVLQRLTPLSFGTLTMLFHLTNILIQYLLAGKLWNPKILLQVPVAVLFGWIIDFFQGLVPSASGHSALQLLYLLLSVFLTALGMVFMLNMDLIQNPPDGTVKAVSILIRKEVGFTKRCYDAVMVLITLLMDLLFYRELYGLGLATVVSAFGVGKTLSYLQKKLGANITYDQKSV